MRIESEKFNDFHRYYAQYIVIGPGVWGVTLFPFFLIAKKFFGLLYYKPMYIFRTHKKIVARYAINYHFAIITASLSFFLKVHTNILASIFKTN
jgi:hypothetical protein